MGTLLKHTIKHTLSKLGPFGMDRRHFVTRHPLPLLTTIRPFSSLGEKFWINYSILYILFIFASILSLSQLKCIKPVEVINAILEPIGSYWINMVISGLLLKFIFSFTFWSFNTLYGIELWSSLVGQRFESNVETWQNISWFDTQFVATPLYDNRELANNLLQYNLLVYYAQFGIVKEPSFTFTDITKTLNYINTAQILPYPSDMTFFLSKNEYLQLGLQLKKQKIPFKLRISKRPIKSFITNDRRFWGTMRYSLLIEPLSAAIQRVLVRKINV